MASVNPMRVTKDPTDDMERIRLWRSSIQKFLHGSKRILKKKGVTTRAYHAMLELWAAASDEGLSIGELAMLIHLRHNSAVGVADELCKRRYAVRARGDLDKRTVHLKLTEDGFTALEDLVNAHLRELEQVSGNIRKVIS